MSLPLQCSLELIYVHPLFKVMVVVVHIGWLIQLLHDTCQFGLTVTQRHFSIVHFPHTAIQKAFPCLTDAWWDWTEACSLSLTSRSGPTVHHRLLRTHPSNIRPGNIHQGHRFSSSSSSMSPYSPSLSSSRSISNSFFIVEFGSRLRRHVQERMPPRWE